MTKKLQKTTYWDELISHSSTSYRLWLEEIHLPPQKNPLSCEKITLKKPLLEALKKFSRTQKISLTTLFSAAWGILLNRFSSNENILYGLSPAAHIDPKKQTLMLGSLLPVNSALNEQNSLLNYLQTLEKQLNTSKKQTKEFRLDLLPSKKSLNYYLVFEKTSQKNNKKSLPMEFSDTTLVLAISEKNPSKIVLYYPNKKFKESSINNLLAHWQIILEKCLTDGDQLVTHFSILTKEEKETLLNNWNKPTRNQRLILESPCVHDLFSQQAKKHPKKLAVHSKESSLDYQTLDQLSNQLAQTLLEKGVMPGDNITVFMERSPSILVAMLAVFKIGAIYVPINPKYPEERIEFIISDCNAKFIVVDDKNTDKIPKKFASKLFAYHDLPGSTTPPCISVDPEQIAYIIYTSGTTGQPKGVMIKHISLINHVFWYREHFNVGPDDRSAQFASQGFDPFFCETIPFLTEGAGIYIIDDHTKLTPSLFLPWLVDKKITICDLPTSYAQVLFTLPWPKQVALRILKVGGESLTRHPNQLFSFDIWNGYGPTETTIEASFIKIYQANVSPEKQKYKHTHPPIGKPLDNFEVYIVDQYLQPVPLGVAGELLIGGLGLSPGYINRTQLTREKFIRNMFSDEPNAKLYRTGDLARWLSDGNIEFLGRLDHQVKISGYRIELSEIENALSLYPDVNDVVVLVRDGHDQKKNIIAYLSPNLNKLRIPFQERCLLSTDDHQFVELITEDFSKEGIAISGLTQALSINQPIRLNVKLPGSDNWNWLSGHIVWQQDQRAGIKVDNTPEQISFLSKSIEFYLSTHNLMQTLHSAAAKRSLRKALKKKLPDYMIPTLFSILPEFPTTLNGKIDLKALPAPQEFERLLERNYVAPRTDTEKALTAIWIDLLHNNQISMSDNFFDLGGNSLLVSQLSIEILQRFNASIPAKILFDSPFIPIIAEYIDSKGKQCTFKSPIQEEVNHDAILSEHIQPTQKISANLHDPQAILLTGAGGFLGIYLLRELLKKTKAKIYCLIRKGNFETPAKRLITTLKRFGLDKEISLANRQIVIIDSDIGLDRFGISAEQYNSMAEKVDMIYHCGAQVNTMSSYPNLRNSNVLGTLEVIKFATHKVDKPIFYVSTLSAAYKLNEEGEYDEEFPDANPISLTGGYAISKWVSERLLTQIKNRHLPVSIFRSGYIFGQSDTGIMNLNDSLLLLIKGCIQLGYAPEWNELIAILPVDFVSQAMVEITLKTPEQSMVYHLDHPYGIMWIDLIGWLNNYGYKIKLCSHKQWQKKLMGISPENALYHFIPYYLSLEDEPNTPHTSVTHTSKALKNLHIPFPEMSDSLLRRYMNYLCSIKFFPVPVTEKITQNEA